MNCNIIFDVFNEGSGQMSSPEYPRVLKPQIQMTVTYELARRETMAELPKTTCWKC